MPWIEPASTAITALELASKAAESSKRVRRHWRRLTYRVQHGRFECAVFGAGGVGKTTVSKLINGTIKPLDAAAPYDESWDTEHFGLTEDIPGYIIAVPGQETRMAQSWPDVAEHITQGRCHTVINVVAFGHHSLGIKYTEHHKYLDGMSRGDFIPLYLELRRRMEVEALERLVRLVPKSPRRLEFITLVNKQDLWWDHRADVRAYYEGGAYAQALEPLERLLGAGRFQHDVLPVSLAMSNLTDGAGVLLAPTVSGYDMPLHLTYLASFFGKVGAISRRGWRR